MINTTSQVYTDLFVGVDFQTPLLGGGSRRYISLDNAASTPALRTVQEAVDETLKTYSSVHRGTGFKSQVSTYAYELAREWVLKFLGANSQEHVCIFGKNTSEALNKLARRFPFTPDRDVVFVSLMEHHSNDLPWRAVAEVVHIGLTSEGSLDEADFDRQLERYAGRLALVSISGASNVTGFINPIHRLARKTHAAGAQIVVDCAQLAPHRPIDMRPLIDPEHLDYVAISAHKMYAPYGTGALVGRRDTFQRGAPDMRGGGEVEYVTVDDVHWSDPPERDEAGSPNTIGAVALAAAIEQLQRIGMSTIAQHEADLTAYLLHRLPEVPGVNVFGETDPGLAHSRLGVVPLHLDGVSHYLAAAILGYEYGIGVRNGCFCAHPYVQYLMGVNEEESKAMRQAIVNGDRRMVPGLVRISFGLYNTFEDIDILIEALKAIQSGSYHGRYTQDKATGQFIPEGWKVDLGQYVPVGRPA